MQDPDADFAALQNAVSRGDNSAVGSILEKYRARLKHVLELRLDARIRGRVDSSDVIQESYIEATQRLSAYLENPDMPFYLWLRFLTVQKLIQVHRRHLGVQLRDAGKEISLYRDALPVTSSAQLAAQLVGKRTSPSEAAVRAEVKLMLQEAINSLDPIDREVLALRHFEQLGNNETAQVLRIQPKAASKRYLRSLRRLRKILDTKPGLLEACDL